ncbi:hypothetical protein E1H12_13710 [Geitlerinema sp. P-1104]|uniref:serine hydrolase n=1 Tax=Geitlerinema sp. P-1104 TaxID=2546230 RepID=UPI0014776FE6|nr:serine hydrolase [Geitlerinema sp. P-1104]NMG59544.1 hypothetical protein [Geitlerinema sp. P-1104]
MNNYKIKEVKLKIQRVTAFFLFLSLGFIVSTVGAIMLQNLLLSPSNNEVQNYQCQDLNSGSDLNFSFSSPQTGGFQNGAVKCFRFVAEANSVLYVNTTQQLVLIYPNKRQQSILGEDNTEIEQSGNYEIRISSSNNSQIYQLDLELSDIPQTARESQSTETSSQFPPPPLSGYPRRPPTNENSDGNFRSDNFTRTYNPSGQDLIYNVSTPPPLEPEENMQAIVDEMVAMVQRRGLSAETLSISLVNLSEPSCCSYGSYQDQTKRFPASVTKLFWIVAYYAKIKEVLIEQTIPDFELYEMINDSDNEVASDVVDAVTSAKSQDEQNFPDWLERRDWLNRFFEGAGYPDINISQKNFPIPKHDLMEPKGFDLQMRNGGTRTLRNYLRTHDVARLLYEIEMGLAVSSDYSEQIKNFMKQNLDPTYWRNIQYNSIEGFFPELLPQNSQVFSKVGWYSGSRQDAAIIYSPDGRTRYILVVFGEDADYAQDWRIFGDLSRFAYDRMTNLN